MNFNRSNKAPISRRLILALVFVLSVALFVFLQLQQNPPPPAQAPNSAPHDIEPPPLVSSQQPLDHSLNFDTTPSNAVEPIQALLDHPKCTIYGGARPMEPLAIVSQDSEGNAVYFTHSENRVSTLHSLAATPSHGHVRQDEQGNVLAVFVGSTESFVEGEPITNEYTTYLNGVPTSTFRSESEIQISPRGTAVLHTRNLAGGHAEVFITHPLSGRVVQMPVNLFDTGSRAVQIPWMFQQLSDEVMTYDIVEGNKEQFTAHWVNYVTGERRHRTIERGTTSVPHFWSSSRYFFKRRAQPPAGKVGQAGRARKATYETVLVDDRDGESEIIWARSNEALVDISRVCSQSGTYCVAGKNNTKVVDMQTGTEALTMDTTIQSLQTHNGALWVEANASRPDSRPCSESDSRISGCTAAAEKSNRLMSVFHLPLRAATAQARAFAVGFEPNRSCQQSGWMSLSVNEYGDFEATLNPLDTAETQTLDQPNP